MELFGIVLAVPAAFVASVVYASILRRIRLAGVFRRAVAWGSYVILCGLLIEWVALIAVGAVGCRTAIGPMFFILHLVIYFLAVPALVNLLVLEAPDTGWSSWLAVGVFGGMLAFPMVLTQVGVAEALYGVDGQTGPYSSSNAGWP
jgi:hypothetical protein